MKSELGLMEPCASDGDALEATMRDMDNRATLNVYEYVSTYLDGGSSDDEGLFSVWITYGKEEKNIMFKVDIDDLELFASGILKQIEIVRREYKEAILAYQTRQ